MRSISGEIFTGLSWAAFIVFATWAAIFYDRSDRKIKDLEFEVSTQKQSALRRRAMYFECQEKLYAPLGGCNIISDELVKCSAMNKENVAVTYHCDANYCAFDCGSSPRNAVKKQTIGEKMALSKMDLYKKWMADKPTKADEVVALLGEYGGDTIRTRVNNFLLCVEDELKEAALAEHIAPSVEETP